jgi:hypothetical protein
MSLDQVFCPNVFLVSNQRAFIALKIKLTGYNFSSQAIDVPLQAKPSHGLLNDTATLELLLHDQTSDNLSNSIG